jgi:hypothetical protein
MVPGMKVRRIGKVRHSDRKQLIEAERALISLWCARVVWALLPVSSGGAIADALDSWSTTTARVAAVLLWLAWAGGIVALFAPHPIGLTALRVIAPCALVCVVLSVTSTAGGRATLAVASTIVAVAFALCAPVAQASVDALSYGDERRLPLHIPTPLLLGPVPVAIALVAAGIAAGPLLIAAEHVVIGVAAIVIGLPIAAVVARSLHSLSRRWIVLVPAGVVIVDPLTLVDPVLLRRPDVAGLQRIAGSVAPEDALDLRLGSVFGSLLVALSTPTPFARRRGRVDAAIVEADRILVAVVRADDFLRIAAERRLPTG